MSLNNLLNSINKIDIYIFFDGTKNKTLKKKSSKMLIPDFLFVFLCVGQQDQGVAEMLKFFFVKPNNFSEGSTCETNAFHSKTFFVLDAI